MSTGYTSYSPFICDIDEDYYLFSLHNTFLHGIFLCMEEAPEAISSACNMFSSVFSAVVPVREQLLFNSLSEVAVKQELK